MVGCDRVKMVRYLFYPQGQCQSRRTDDDLILSNAGLICESGVEDLHQVCANGSDPIGIDCLGGRQNWYPTGIYGQFGQE